MATKISDLTSVSSLDGSELFEVVQSGESKKATTNQLKGALVTSDSYSATTDANGRINISSLGGVNTANFVSAVAYRASDVTISLVTSYSTSYYLTVYNAGLTVAANTAVTVVINKLK